MIRQKHIVQMAVLLCSVLSSVHAFGLSVSSSSASSQSSNSLCSSISSSSSSSVSSVPTASLQCAISSSDAWGQAFQMTVNVKNTSDAPINAWDVQLNLAAGHSITSSWDVKLLRNGNQVTASNANWNGNLQPGQSASFGAMGSHPGTFVKPECVTAGGANQAPVANVEVEVHGATVFIDARGSIDPDDDKLKYTIAFGDNKKIDHSHGWHTFRASGNYTAFITVSDGEHMAVAIKSFDVTTDTSGNRAPIAKLSLDSSDTRITAKAIASFDQDGDDLTYTWTFGDAAPFEGTAHEVFNANQTTMVTLTVSDGVLANTIQEEIVAGCGVYDDRLSQAEFTYTIDGLTINVDARDSWEVEEFAWNFGDGSAEVNNMITSHTYAESGEYLIRLRTRSTLSVSVREEIVQISNDANNPPQLELPTCAEKLLAENNYITECHAGAANDPDGDELTILWEMGDGKSYTPASITEVISHQYDVAGEYDITTTVSDGELSVSKTLSVSSNGKNTTPVNTPPVACFVVWINAIFPPPLDGSFDANCSTDADGDPLTYTWVFGDGTTGAGKNINHYFPWPGRFATTLTVSDGKTSTSITQSQQFGQNRPPQAECTYEITSDWGTGFSAKVVIMNTSDAPIDGWTVGWSYPREDRDRITSFWGANVTVNGIHYSASNLPWNKIIAPGGKVEIGLQGSKLAGVPPEALRVRGWICRLGGLPG